MNISKKQISAQSKNGGFLGALASFWCIKWAIYVFSYFPFGFEGRMWDLIVSVPDHCLSFYFASTGVSKIFGNGIILPSPPPAPQSNNNYSTKQGPT